jgi:hypothetical protein
VERFFPRAVVLRMMSSAFVAAIRRERGGRAAMRGFPGYLSIGGFAVLAMALLTLAGLAVGARPVAEPGQVVQHVDRTHKGDRLDLHMTVGTQRVRQAPERPGASPIGCEPVFSSLAEAGRANYLGRCDAKYPGIPSVMAG